MRQGVLHYVHDLNRFCFDEGDQITELHCGGMIALRFGEQILCGRLEADGQDGMCSSRRHQANTELHSTCAGIGIMTLASTFDRKLGRVPSGVLPFLASDSSNFRTRDTVNLRPLWLGSNMAARCIAANIFRI